VGKVSCDEAAKPQQILQVEGVIDCTKTVEFLNGLLAREDCRTKFAVAGYNVGTVSCTQSGPGTFSLVDNNFNTCAGTGSALSAIANEFSKFDYDATPVDCFLGKYLFANTLLSCKHFAGFLNDAIELLALC